MECLLGTQMGSDAMFSLPHAPPSPLCQEQAPRDQPESLVMKDLGAQVGPRQDTV